MRNYIFSKLSAVKYKRKSKLWIVRRSKKIRSNKDMHVNTIPDQILKSRFGFVEYLLQYIIRENS